MTTPLTSKNPLRDYRKAVAAVLTKYFAVDPAALRFRVNVLRTHRAQGHSPAYVALYLGRARNLPLSDSCRRDKPGRRTRR